MTKPTKEEINKWAHEKMGKCWHMDACMWVHGETRFYCDVCGDDGFHKPNPDYHTWKHFGPFFEEIQKDERWAIFAEEQLAIARELGKYRDVFEIINPPIFMPLAYNFWNGGELYED